MSEELEQVPPWDRGIFVGILWGGFSLATIFTAVRFTARWRSVRRFYLDDAFALAAWILITASCVLTQAFLLELYKVIYGASSPPVDNVWTSPPRQSVTRNLEAKAATDMLGYSALWAIKFSFLFFFRRIYKFLDSWMKYWWIIMAITIVSFVGTGIASIVYYILIDYDCLSSFFEYTPRCTLEHVDHNMALTDVDIGRGAFDIFTDILITLIPATMLWKIRVSWRRKLIVGSVLSLTLITMALAGLRLYILIAPAWVFENVHLDMNWLSIEVYIALMALSLGSIPSAFAKRNSKPRYTPPSERQQKHSPRRWMASLLGTSRSEGTDSHQSLFSQGATQWGVSVNDNMERIGQSDTAKP